MDNRKKLILEAIIRYFTDTATPVGSKTLMSQFDVSSATIRSDMSYLEKEGMLYQPHTSAGRIPTEIGYRYFVDEIIDPAKQKKNVLKQFEDIKKLHFREKAREKVFDAVSILSQITQDIAFATIPQNNQTYYLGIANLLKQPEFIQDMPYASRVVEVLEKGFLTILDKLELDKKIRIFIGKENIVPEIQSCSMLAVAYNCEGFDGIMGILGPMRMDYSYNIAALEVAFNMIAAKDS